MAYGEITVDSNTSIEIVAANTQRHSLLLVNLGAGVLYLGNNSSVTTATGLFLSSTTNLAEDSSGLKVYSGAYFGISNTQTKVRYWERTI